MSGEKIRRWFESYVTLGRFATATVGIVGVVGLYIGLYKGNHDVNLQLWQVVGIGLIAALLVVVAFAIGRSRHIAPTEADRLAGELEVANTYLFRTEDFMSSFREVVSSQSVPTVLAGLPRLRDLLFDAVVQGVNTQRGEHIRCAYFVKAEDEDVLIARAWRGHSERVRELRLPANAESIAGRAWVTRRPVYVPDAPSDTRLYQTPVAGSFPIGTLLCLPMFPYSLQVDTPIGILSVTSNKVSAFTDADQNFISVCASLIGLLELAEEIFSSIDQVRAALEEHTAVLRDAGQALEGELQQLDGASDDTTNIDPTAARG